MRNLIKVLLFFIPFSGIGQIDKEIRDYPKPDCSGAILKVFFNNTNRIILYPNSKKIANTDDNSHIILEGQLTKEDYNKPIEIHFPITEYENWEKLDIPVIRTKEGFKYKNRNFNSKDDAFMILSPTRYIVSGNSQAIIDKVSYYTIPLYPITIIENGDYAIFADTEYEINIQEIITKNYYSQKSKFFQVKVSNEINTFDSALYVLDLFVDEFCDSARLELPEKAIRAYAHSNPNVERLLSNHWSSDCTDMDENVVFATVKFDIIHSVGNDFINLSHETIHLVWNNNVKMKNFFLNEGVAMYYSIYKKYSIDYFENRSLIIEQFSDILKANSSYDLMRLILDESFFWQNPIVSYPYAGFFCKFLIEKYGLDNFKSLYAKYEKLESFEYIYGKNLEKIIIEFKEYIENQ